MSDTGPRSRNQIREVAWRIGTLEITSRRLSPYELIAFVGKGGMGEGWKAHDTRLNREVGS